MTDCPRKRPRDSAEPCTSSKKFIVAAALAWVQLLSSSTSSCSAFVSTQQKSNRASTFLSFRNDASSIFASTAATTMPSPFLYHSTTTTATKSNTSSSLHGLASELPTWLAVKKSHLAEENLQSLHETMLSTRFFTETEILRLRYAIEEAAQGDSELVAGAAEFCQILAGETMEMGLTALVAAAFHFCACVQARQQRSRVITIPNKASLQHNFGAEAEQIASDASRLKQLEMVASRVLDSSTDNCSCAAKGLPHQPSCARVRPDARDSENLRKLLMSETRDWRALAIRSAACLFRLRGLLSSADNTTTKKKALTSEAIRVGREALYIYAPLASRLGMHRLKNELEGAAFMLLYQRQYQRVNPSNNPKRAESMKQVLESVQDDITSMLEQDEEFASLVSSFSVAARVKEPYSLWKKMLRQRCNDMLKVPDALALRIILNAKKLTSDEPTTVTRARERALCYYAQTLALKRYQPAQEPRFKDYIEQPKRNGYQSLHYTAHTEYENQDWTLEIQVRSGEMHQVAEFGLASHWEYKASQKKGSKKSSSESKKESITTGASNTLAADLTVSIANSGQQIDLSSDAYLRKVQEWHWQQHGGAKAAAASKFALPPMHGEEDEGETTSTGSFEEHFTKISSPILQSRIRAERIRMRNQRLQPYIQALNTAQSDLTREYVFVFLTQDPNHPSSASVAEGKVLALPSGACVLDALRAGEQALGYSTMKIQDSHLALNGSATSITRQLSNGDVLTFPTIMANTAALHRP